MRRRPGARAVHEERDKALNRPTQSAETLLDNETTVERARVFVNMACQDRRVLVTENSLEQIFAPRELKHL